MKFRVIGWHQSNICYLRAQSFNDLPACLLSPGCSSSIERMGGGAYRWRLLRAKEEGERVGVLSKLDAVDLCARSARYSSSYKANMPIHKIGVVSKYIRRHSFPKLCKTILPFCPTDSTTFTLGPLLVHLSLLRNQLFWYSFAFYIMDPNNKPKGAEQQNTCDQPLSVDQYQRRWDQIYRDTCEQIDKIRGDTWPDPLYYTYMKGW